MPVGSLAGGVGSVGECVHTANSARDARTRAHLRGRKTLTHSPHSPKPHDARMV
jgi:hypothetical protein